MGTRDKKLLTDAEQLRPLGFPMGRRMSLVLPAETDMSLVGGGGLRGTCSMTCFLVALRSKMSTETNSTLPGEMTSEISQLE